MLHRLPSQVSANFFNLLRSYWEAANPLSLFCFFGSVGPYLYIHNLEINFFVFPFLPHFLGSWSCCSPLLYCGHDRYMCSWWIYFSHQGDFLISNLLWNFSWNGGEDIRNLYIGEAVFVVILQFSPALQTLDGSQKDAWVLVLSSRGVVVCHLFQYWLYSENHMFIYYFSQWRVLIR